MNLRTLGKILGALGLVSLLSAPYSYFLTTGSLWIAGGKVVLGALLLGAYFATNLREFNQFASRKSTFYLVSSIAMLAVVLVALVGVNYIAAKKNKSWDLTTKKIFTLAPQTRSTLSSLHEKVNVYAFLSPKDADYEQVDRLLHRYRDIAPDRFEYLFKDPLKAPDLAQKYQLSKGQTTLVLTRGSGDKETHTSVAVSNGVTEQDLTNALIKLNSVGEQKVYFTTGHGEWPLEADGGKDSASLSKLKRSLGQEGYVAEALNLSKSKDVPRDASLVVIAAARSKFLKGESDQLARYLDQGGHLLFFAEPAAEAGLETLLATYGVEVDPGQVAEYVQGVDDPYLIISDGFGDTELAREMKASEFNVQFPAVRALTIIRKGLAEGTQVDPVVLTSSTAFEVRTPTENPRPENGGRSGAMPLVVQATRRVSGTDGKRNDETRIVVFGGSQVIVDAFWGFEPNRNMVMNAFAWATSQVQKITIRPPDRDISTVDLDAPRLARIRFVSMDLVPLGLLGLGLAVWLNRRSK